MSATEVRRPRILLPTVRTAGGVGTMQSALASCLEAAGAEVTLAYYQPYRLSPEMSVPVWRLFQRRPSRRSIVDRNGRRCIEIGAWLPEIEALRYRATRLWRETLKDFDACVSVCGTVFSARPTIDAGVATLAWVATPYDGDRAARTAKLPKIRWLLDRLIDRPWCRRLERRLLQAGRILALSDYSRLGFEKLQPKGRYDVLCFPLDTGLFNPGDRAPPLSGKSVTIGVVGRLDDPRKNVNLLLEALALLKDRYPFVTAKLVGMDRNNQSQKTILALGLKDRVQVHQALPHGELPGVYRSLDILVITSLQEGLCLVGLEALACGTPVISTRCGGPEDYIEDGKTGRLIEPTANDLAAAIADLLEKPQVAQEMAKRGLELVENKYTKAHFARQLLAELATTCGLKLAVPAQW